MTAPGWYPPPNPGGQVRRATRNALVTWVNAQHIAGIGHFYASRAATMDFDAYPGPTGSDCAALLKIKSLDDIESRLAYDGPLGRGGKLIHFGVGLQIQHISYNPDQNQTDEAESDYDRIIDSLKDCLRGIGRDLGRPDFVLMVGEWPKNSGIVVRSNDPIRLGNGNVQRDGIMSFNTSVYIADQGGH